MASVDDDDDDDDESLCARAVRKSVTGSWCTSFVCNSGLDGFFVIMAYSIAILPDFKPAVGVRVSGKVRKWLQSSDHSAVLNAGSGPLRTGF
jgi:hypothetical protein